MFKRYTEQMILESMKGKIDNEIDTREGTFTHDILSPAANEIARCYSMLEYALDQAFLSSAEGIFLTEKAKEYGVSRKGERKAIGRVTFYGEPGTTVPSGTIVSTVGGLQFATDNHKNIGIEGSVTSDIEALGVGEEYNVKEYTIRNLNTSVAGVERIENKEKTVGGASVETDDSLRIRAFQMVMYPAASGNANHYREWAYEIDGVGSVKVIPTWNGAGTVKIIVLDSDNSIANATLLKKVKDHIEKVRPIGAIVTVETAIAKNITVAVSIKQFGSKLMEDARRELEERINKYLRERAFDAEVVSYNKIIAILERMIEDDIISDYKNVRLNEQGAGQDVVLREGEIPALERIDINAYN